MGYIQHSLSDSEASALPGSFSLVQPCRRVGGRSSYWLSVGSTIAYASAQFWLIAPLLALGLFVFLGTMVPIWTTEIGVTNQRLIYKRGLLWRTTQELQLRAIEEVKLTQGCSADCSTSAGLSCMAPAWATSSLPSLADPVGLRKALQDGMTAAAQQAAAGAAPHVDTAPPAPPGPPHRSKRRSPNQAARHRGIRGRSCFVSSCRALRADDRATKHDPIAHDLARRLRAELQGEVLFDRFSRGRYSTDASHYQIEPLGVVVPKTDDDVRAAMAIAREEGVPLLPRGGGTSQSGQTVGRALVIDLQQAPEPARRRSMPRDAPASSSRASCSTS